MYRKGRLSIGGLQYLEYSKQQSSKITTCIYMYPNTQKKYSKHRVVKSEDRYN